VFIILLLSILLTPSAVESKTPNVPYYMYTAANAFQIDIALLYAICSVESKCKPGSINKDDATKYKKSLGVVEHSLGMFQIKLATAKSLGFKGSKKELMKSETNTWYAAKLIDHLYTRYNHDTIKVISAYNAGRYTKCNKKYVNLVLEHYARYKLDKRF